MITQFITKDKIKSNMNQVLENITKNPSYFNNKDIINNICNNNFDLINLIVSEVINSIMKSERDIYLNNHQEDNANGYYDRSLNIKSDKIDLNVPRSRDGDFRPSILPDKYKRYHEDYKELIVNLIISGNSKSQIKSILAANGQEYCADALNKIYDDLNQRLLDFKTRELPKELLFLIIDGYHADVKENNKVQKIVVYTLLGVDFDGYKQILGFYPMLGDESLDKWKIIFQDILNRGLKKVLLFISDNFNGLKHTINALFERSDHQLCLIHLMRNVKKNMTKEDAKNMINLLKSIKDSKDEFNDNYLKDKLLRSLKDKRKTYKDFIEKLEQDLDNYLTFLKYPYELRKFIYSTNPVESINSRIEKIRLKQEGYFQSMNNLELNLFLISNKLLKRWFKKANPFIVYKAYDIRQMFNLKFFEKNIEQNKQNINVNKIYKNNKIYDNNLALTQNS